MKIPNTSRRESNKYEEVTGTTSFWAHGALGKNERSSSRLKAEEKRSKDLMQASSALAILFYRIKQVMAGDRRTAVSVKEQAAPRFAGLTAVRDDFAADAVLVPQDPLHAFRDSGIRASIETGPAKAQKVSAQGVPRFTGLPVEQGSTGFETVLMPADPLAPYRVPVRRVTR